MRPALGVGACALAACAIAIPTPAHADDGPYGALLAFAVAGGTALGGLPLLLGREARAPLFLDVDLGVGGELDSLSLGADLEGSFGRDSRWGWASRTQCDLLLDDGTEASSLLVMNLRFDLLGTLTLVGRSFGPFSVDALAGATLWPSAADRDNDTETEPYMAMGPSFGMRTQARVSIIRASLEASYLPVAFEAPTRSNAHIDLASEFGLLVWKEVAITAALERLIGFGGEERYEGTEITLGLSFDLNQLD